MAEYHAIANVDEFVSDYYLTSDDKKQTFLSQVTKRIKQWQDEESQSGTQSPFARLQGSKAGLQNKLAVLQEAAQLGREEQIEEAYALTRRALGYAEALHEITFEDNHGDLVLEKALGIDHGGLKNKAILITAEYADSVEDIRRTSVRGAVSRDGKPVTGQDLRVQKVVGEMFLSDDQPDFIVILAGRFVVLAERETWPLGRFLAVDLLLALERNDAKAAGELRRVTCILAAENIRLSAEGDRWWSKVIEDSRNHSVKVSEDLRHAIRESIETIANDVLDRTRAQARRKAELDGLDYEGQKAAVQAAIDAIDVADLTKQCLRYLYRILFLLFAEASPELEILPVGVTEYDEGYSLTRLRNQILRPPATQRDQNGTYLYDSLQVLFDQVNGGYNADLVYDEPEEIGRTAEGLRFEALEADLFKYEQAHYIEDVKLSNAAMHKVLTRLLLSKEQKGKDRGFISYATLGVTELGQVYEGLMSYSGRIASETLLEVAKNGKADKGSWLVEESIANADPETFSKEHFVTKENDTTGVDEPIRHQPGSFVYRQSARDRERSASFYTPKVLTSFTVGQAIEELKNAGHGKQAAEILDLKICEPAMGSGAFAVEAIRQLAEWYLDKAEEEAIAQGKEGIPAEDRQQELQKVKAYIALHNTYGVDLNATAVELGEIALWLDTMTKGLKAPWFGLHLRRGNSLIGASHSVYSRRQVHGPGKAELAKMKERAKLQGEKFTAPVNLHLSNPPKHIPLNGDVQRGDDEAYQFLLPAPTWGSAAEVKQVKDLCKNEIKALKAWRKSVQARLGDADAPDPTKSPAAIRIKGDLFSTAVNLSARVDELWKFVTWRLSIAESQAQRKIDVWGLDVDEDKGDYVTRAQIEDFLANENGTYQRVKLVMDIWCALAFWPLTGPDLIVDGELVAPPTRTQWYEAIALLLGDRTKEGTLFSAGATWDELEQAEQETLAYSGAQPVESVIRRHPWISVCQRIAEKQAFFHWELQFASIFERGGFDLQVGNPPWVRPRTDEEALLAELDPWWVIAHKPTQAAKKERKAQAIATQDGQELIVGGLSEVVSTAEWLNSTTNYPELEGQQPDLYRAFMAKCWSNTNQKDGVAGLIHPESHFAEAKAVPLRKIAYQALLRHFQFVNALMIFEIDDHVVYGVHIYGKKQSVPNFVNLTKMYHPRTAAESLVHDGSGVEPGIKDDQGRWDLRPHRSRIQHVDAKTLDVWSSVLGSPGDSAPQMVYTVTGGAAEVLKRLAENPRMDSLELAYSAGWHETADRKKGIFEVSWQRPDTWEDVILQGPHLGILTPFIKEPNPTLKHNQDWSQIDHQLIPSNYVPATGYLPGVEQFELENLYGHDAAGRSIKSLYRLSWRSMAATTGYRTFYPCIIPPGSMHVNGIGSVFSCRDTWARDLLLAAGVSSSIFVDFFLRSFVNSLISAKHVNMLPLGFVEENDDEIIYLTARLNCMTEAWRELWERATGESWSGKVPFRSSYERLEAQAKLDRLTSIRLGMGRKEFESIYKAQFPVFRAADEGVLDRIERTWG